MTLCRIIPKMLFIAKKQNYIFRISGTTCQHLMCVLYRIYHVASQNIRTRFTDSIGVFEKYLCPAAAMSYERVYMHDKPIHYLICNQTNQIINAPHFRGQSYVAMKG